MLSVEGCTEEYGMYVCVNVCMHVYVCMDVFMYVVYVCMCECVYACICMYDLYV